MRYFLGLDLARVRDWSVLSGLVGTEGGLAVNYLRRWRPRREDLVDAIEDTIDLIARHRMTRPVVALDANGIGREAADVAIEGGLSLVADVYPILPTHSTKPARQRGDGLIYVHKGELVATTFRLLGERRLAIAAGLEEGPRLRREIEELRQVPTRRGTGTTWSHPGSTTTSHDDLLMSVALAAWVAERLRTQGRIGAIRPAKEVRWRSSRTPSGSR
ncbi:MAG: hypothetical protein ACYC4P_11580 [Thermoanaerobaculia bacterium]